MKSLENDRKNAQLAARKSAKNQLRYKLFTPNFDNKLHCRHKFELMNTLEKIILPNEQTRKVQYYLFEKKKIPNTYAHARFDEEFPLKSSD